MYETLLFLGTCAAVNLSYLTFNTYGNAISGLISLVVCAIVLGYPAILMCLYL